MPVSKQIVIVGGGVIGLCAAYYSLQHGHRVTLIERGAPDHDSCSRGNAGLVTPSHVVPLAAPGMVSMGLKMMWKPHSPFYIKPRLNLALMRWCWRFFRSSNPDHVKRSAPLLRDLSLASRVCFSQLANACGNAFGLEKKSTLMLCKSAELLEKEKVLATQVKQLGLSAEILSPEEAGRLDPGLELDVAGAVYFPDDCHLSPDRFVLRMTEAVKEADAKIIWSAKTLRWHRTSQAISAIEVDNERIEADEFLITAGAWTTTVARQLDLHVPIQGGRGYSVTLPAPTQNLKISSLLMEARIAATPMGQALRLAGTMEITGLNSHPKPARFQKLLKAVPGYFPQLNGQDFNTRPIWSGFRPCSPDGLPYLGRTQRYGNLSIASGHAMVGLSLAPVTGQTIAKLVSGEDPEFDLSLLAPERYDR